MYIYIQPFDDIDKTLLKEIGSSLEKVFGVPYKIRDSMELPYNAYMRRRKQWHSTTILDSLKKNIPSDAEKVLGVTSVDLFVPELNFVFGEADSYFGVAVISLARLNPNFYGFPKNDELFKERALKEAVHELGHTYGLNHCDKSTCIMFFSNTLSDTDKKGPGFCDDCFRKLKGVK